MSLTLISTTDITGGTSNKVTIDNVFSADYKVYCIQFHNTNAGTQRENNSMDFRLVDSTGTEIAANYDARHYMFRGYTNTPFTLGGNNRDEFALIYHDTAANDGLGNGTIWLFDPFGSNYTYQNFQESGSMAYPSTTKIGVHIRGGAVHKENTSCTGISFTNRDNYSITNLSCNIYGLEQ